MLFCCARKELIMVYLVVSAVPLIVTNAVVIVVKIVFG